MGKRNSKKNIHVPSLNENGPNLKQSLKSLHRLKKVSSKSECSLGATNAVSQIDEKSSFIDNDNDSSDHTDISHIKENFGYQLQAMESRMNADSVKSISTLKCSLSALESSFQRELSEHKNSILKWMAGIIITIIIGIFTFHSASLTSLKSDLTDLIRSSIQSEIHKK